MAALTGAGGRFHEIRRVVTELATYDFETPDRSLRLRTIHPGVSLDQVLEATSFELAMPEQQALTSRPPTAEELHLIRNVIDPTGIRKAEFR